MIWGRGWGGGHVGDSRRSENSYMNSSVRPSGVIHIYINSAAVPCMLLTWKYVKSLRKDVNGEWTNISQGSNSQEENGENLTEH
jgi:hypothetical protein